MYCFIESSLHGVERARLGQEATALGQETLGAVEDTSVEEIDDGKLVERSETLVYIRFMMKWSFVIRIVEFLEIVGQLVQSGGLFDVVGLEKLRGHSAVLTDLAEAVLAADAHTCGGVREVGDDRWDKRNWTRRSTGRRPWCGSTLSIAMLYL